MVGLTLHRSVQSDRAQLLAVAAGYLAVFVAWRRIAPFSLESPWFVCTAMICFLGLAFMAGRVFPLRMPRPLRKVRRWETGRGAYRWLGVPAFGRLLRRTPLRLLNRQVYLGAHRDGAALAAQLEAAEASHFWAAALVVPYMVHAAVTGAWAALFVVSLAQVAINVYPVMHLRLVRRRVESARRPVATEPQ